MASTRQIFQHSFVDKRILSTFLIDVLFTGMLAVLIFILTIIQQNKTAALGIASPEQLQDLLSTAPEQAQTVLLQLQNYLLTFTIGLLLLLLVWILGYPLSRKYVWQILSGKKQSYGKWILLSLVIVLPLIALSILLILVRLLLGFLSGKLPFALQQYTSSGLLLSLGLLLLFYVIGSYFSFSHSGKVWESIGKGFHYFRNKKWWQAWLLVLATALVVNLLLSFVQRFFLTSPQLFTILSTIVFLLFIAWLRVYVVQTVAEG